MFIKTERMKSINNLRATGSNTSVCHYLSEKRLITELAERAYFSWAGANF